ncbi:MAG: hypothetical protein WAT39_23095 [Planctomycetota bacterium]
MKTILSLAFAAALCAPVSAQKMGMTNTNAPTVKQTVMAGDAKISLDYTSITWASGSTMTAIMDKDKGARARTRVNNTAPNEPLGTLSTSIDVTCGDLQLGAGEYKVYFTIGDDLSWNINFASKDKTHTMKLALAASEHESKRLLLCLYAEEDGAAGVYVSFGKQSGMLSFKPGAKKEGK